MRSLSTLLSLSPLLSLTSKLPPLPPTAKRLFLVRHGEVIPPGGVHGVHYGDMDVVLSPLGEEEADAAGEAMRGIPVDFVVSSPLVRAVFGAERIRDGRTFGCFPLSPDTDDGFRELCRGAWRGKTKETIGLDLYEQFNNCDPAATPAEGESIPEVRARVLAARDRALSALPPGGTAAVVSHLWVTRSVIADAMGMPSSEMAGLAIGTASISVVDYEGGEQVVRVVGVKPEMEVKVRGRGMGGCFVGASLFCLYVFIGPRVNSLLSLVPLLFPSLVSLSLPFPPSPPPPSPRNVSVAGHG